VTGVTAARSRRSSKVSNRSATLQQAPEPKPGVQFMVRERTGRPVTGRPDPAERQQIAEGVGALLRQLRLEVGMGVRDLERRSGISRATISLLESGQRRPRRSTLGWLAWGVDASNVNTIKAQLVEAAGRSLVTESRWSERAKRRRVFRALVAEPGMPVPLPLLAPYAVAALGPLLPGDLGRLRQVEEMARRGEVPLPEGLAGSVEALAVGNILAAATRQELAIVGRNTNRWADYPTYRERLVKLRARRAAEREAFMAARRHRGGDAGALARVLALGHAADGLAAADRELSRRP